MSRLMTLREAMGFLYGNIDLYKEINWVKLGVTRDSYLFYQIIYSCGIYGYLTLDGKKYGRQKIIKINYGDIPGRGNNNRCSDDFNTIIAPDGNPKFIEVAVKKKELNKLIKELRKTHSPVKHRSMSLINKFRKYLGDFF